MKNILMIDACVRSGSRTRALAEHLLSRLDGEVTRLALYETALPALDEARLARRMDSCTRRCFDDGYYDFAKQFAQADSIVIAAPFWDGSFPTALKQYIETVCITNLTFRYTENGVPEGLCRAKQLWYVTSAGGPIGEDPFGWGYLRALAQNMFGSPQAHFVKAEGLDIRGADERAIMVEAMREIDAQCGAQV